MKMRLWIFVGCIAVPFNGFCVFPHDGTLLQRLGGFKSAGCVIPGVFRKLVEREKSLAEKAKVLSSEEREKAWLTPFRKVAGGKMIPNVIVEDDGYDFDLESGEGIKDEYGEDDSADSDKILSELLFVHCSHEDLFGDEKIREKETKRCNDIFESTEFWKGVLCIDWFNAFLEELCREDGVPYVRLDVSVRSFLRDTFPEKPNPLPKASDNLKFELGHGETIDKTTGKRVRVSDHYTWLDILSPYDSVSDLEFRLRMIVNMATEESEEIRLLDAFILNGKQVTAFGEKGLRVFKKQ